MIEVGDRFERIVAQLARRRIGEVELYLKEGRSHRVEIGPQGGVELHSDEAGWAVRAGGNRGSFFCCGTGLPEAEGNWPQAKGGPLGLPAPREPVTPESAFEHRPLIVESKALAQLATFGDVLRKEHPEARVVRAVLEDGESRARLVSTRGMDCSYRSRAATLYLEVIADGCRRSGQFVARAAEDFDPRALAGRFGTLLGLGGAPGPGRASGAEVVLAPAVAVRILAGLLPGLIGPEARQAARWPTRGDRFSRRLTVIDDGGLTGGVLEAAADGEGVPTRAVSLIEEGVYQQPLLSWREGSRGESSGCSLRPSWRQPPESGPTHLFVQPDPAVAPGDLVGSVTDGFYGVDALGAGRFDLAGDSFELPVTGFRLERGQATAPIGAARLSGCLSDLLKGLRAVARDLSFQPVGCLLGSPTLLLVEVELDGGRAPA